MLAFRQCVLFCLLVPILVLPAMAATRYVWTNSPAPAAPYTNWITAARTIQDAVNVAVDGDTVLVTNGVYDKGVTFYGGSDANRVCITKPITVGSVNGPQVTIIKGAPGSNGSNDADAVRGVFMANGRELVGFTVTNGYTSTNFFILGGGVNLSINCLVSNCVLSGNKAFMWGGGGAYLRHGGVLNNCIVWCNIGNYINDIDNEDGTNRYTCASDGVANGVNGCITNNPMFTDAASSNFHLQAGSPCINAGANAYAPINDTPDDMAGNPRIMDYIVDMGAYEYYTFALASTGTMVSGSGGANSLSVTATVGYVWSATSSNNWITITGGEGSGNGTAAYTVSPNTSGTDRQGTIVISDAIFAIIQRVLKSGPGGLVLLLLGDDEDIR